MLTLKELKKVVKEADMESGIPSAKVLKESGAEIVAKEVLDTDTSISVYENGYVLYQEGAKTTVFPLHKCGGYEYENNDGTRKRVKSEFFDNENWYVLPLLIASDRMIINQVRIDQYHGFISYSAVVEDRKYLIDPGRNCLDNMIEKELIEDLLQTLTKRQKEIIYLYFWEQMKQQDIAKSLGISQQTVGGTIKRSIEIMRRHISESEN